MTNKYVIYGKEISLIIILLTVSVIVNWPVLISNFIYPEQPLYYNINQLIHSFSDLLNTYTHPKILDTEVPFSRPSGSFLMYQLLTPLIGWYNLKALTVVNFLFLGLTGYLIIKLYSKLFPGFKVGGYIAFSLYLMSPTLIMARLVIMHFDYAYVFFAMLSLYCFVIFCKKNFNEGAPPLPTKIQHLTLLFATILFYIVAITFKEAAIIVGPGLAIYLLCSIYQPGNFIASLRNKEILTLIGLLGLITCVLAFYIKSWLHHIYHPMLVSNRVHKMLGAAHDLVWNLLSLPNKGMQVGLDFYHYVAAVYQVTNLPTGIRYTIWVLLAVTLISLINVYSQKNINYKKSLTFLLMALVLFLLMPIIWATAFPWHLSLSLVCEALIIGFGVEFYARQFFNKWSCYVAGILLALVLAASTYQVDQNNLGYIDRTIIGFDSKLIYNAVFHAPTIKNKLDDQSILVVQDNMGIGDFMLGDGTYPALAVLRTEQFDLDNLMQSVGQNKNFWPIQPLYNGTLFRWAYALPKLNEELIYFKINDMSVIPDAILLSWARHLNNIFSVTYDKSGYWFDNTVAFKKNVLSEQKRRRLLLSQYHILPQMALHSVAINSQRLPYADHEICQAYCDNHKSCKGFTYTQITLGQINIAKCFYYHKITADKRACKVCTGYIKAGEIG